MNIRNKILIIISVIAAILASGCDDESSPRPLDRLPTSITLSLPDDIKTGTVRDGELTFYNITTGETTSVLSDSHLIETSIMAGFYNISYQASVLLENGITANLRGHADNIAITSSGNLTLDTFCNIENDDLIISEIFFTGTLQASGNSYVGDSYVKLYNNTDHTVYADGLTFFESKFITTQKYDYTPDILPEAMAVDALYTIPGNGTEHPVEPGQYLLLADIGIDHRTLNPNSFDLSHADFEWFDQSTNPSVTDIDNPDVPNLDKWYCYTQTIFMLHNRGFKAYGIARIPVDRDTYLAGNVYTYDYINVTQAGTFPMSGQAYRLDNNWIVDVVNCSVESTYQWNVSTPSLDAGWTGCGTLANDKSRFFHAVRRRLLRLEADGRPVFKDTNNSTADFNAYCTPSEIELQHSATDINGTRATTVTYDGVTPIKTTE